MNDSWYGRIVHDPVGWIQIGIAVMTLAYSLWLRRTALHARSITWATLEQRALIPKSHFPLGVTYAGVQVESPHLVVVRIANSGNEAIVPSAYESPLVISTGAKVLSHEVTRSRPTSLSPTTTGGELPGAIEVTPSLLNRKDMFEIQLLVDGAPVAVSLSGRIAGVQTFQRIVLPQDSNGRTWRYSVLDKAIFVFLPLAVIVGGIVFVTNGNGVSRVFGTALIAATLLWPQYIIRSARRNALLLA